MSHERATLHLVLEELERYDPSMTVGDAIYVIKDMIADKGAPVLNEGKT